MIIYPTSKLFWLTAFIWPQIKLIISYHKVIFFQLESTNEIWDQIYCRSSDSCCLLLKCRYLRYFHGSQIGLEHWLSAFGYLVTYLSILYYINVHESFLCVWKVLPHVSVLPSTFSMRKAMIKLSPGGYHVC